MSPKKIKLAIFSSGSGSNAQKIIEYFKGHSSIEVSLVMCNNKNAYVLERAKVLGIPSRVFDRKAFCESNEVVNELKSQNISWVILAGFLWLIPENLIEAYPCNIINIHPALLPLYGGRGMYGMHVHKAVLAAGEKESGISIHLVNKNYDEGPVIFQARCLLTDKDTPEDVAKKVQVLEHEHYPRVIEETILKNS